MAPQDGACPLPLSALTFTQLRLCIEGVNAAGLNPELQVQGLVWDRPWSCWMCPPSSGDTSGMSLTFPALLSSVSDIYSLYPTLFGIFYPKVPQVCGRNLGLNLQGSLRQLWAGILSAQEFI